MKMVEKEKVIDFVIGKVNQLTKNKYDNITKDTKLALVGVDSLNAVMLCGYIEEEYDIEVEPILMFQYKTADKVAEAILLHLES